MGFKSNQRSQWTEIRGNPEGNRLGTPGDLLYDPTTGTLWLKAFGRGTKTGWRQLATSNAAGDVDLFTDGAEVRISTQVDSRDTSRRYATFDAQNVVLPPGATALALIDTLSDDGRNSKIRADVSGVDAADFTSLSVSGLTICFRRAAGALAIVSAFPNLSEVAQVGPVGTFGPDVLFTISAIPPDILLAATNTAGADRTGHITATWMVQQGGLRV